MDLSTYFRVPGSVRIGSFVKMLILLFIPAVIAAFALAFPIGLGLALFTSVTPSGLTLLAVSASIAAILWFYATYLTSIRLVNRAEKYYLDYAQRLHDSLGTPDYWFAYPRCAIGVDLGARKLAFGAAVGKKDRPGEIHVFSLEKLKRVEAREIIPSEFMATGGAGTNAVMRAQSLNNAARNSAMERTGLLLTLDDIDLPKVLLVMPIDYAEKWVVVIKKAFHGTLDRPEASRYFPGEITNGAY